MLFQTKRQKEIAAIVKMLMENIDKLLFYINTSILAEPNVRLCVQQSRVNTPEYKITPMYVSFVIILYEAVNICIHCFC